MEVLINEAFVALSKSVPLSRVAHFGGLFDAATSNIFSTYVLFHLPANCCYCGFF